MFGSPSATVHFGPTNVRNNLQETRPSRFPRVRLLLVVIPLLLAGAVLFPPTFRLALHGLLRWDAARHAVNLKIGRMEGSIFTPLTLGGVEIESVSLQAGTATVIRIEKAEVECSWKDFALRRGTRLRIDGLDGAMRFYAPKPGANTPEPEPSATGATATGGWRERFLPSQIEVVRANFSLGGEREGIRVAGLAFAAGRLGPGTIGVERIEINHPWLKKTFTGIRGDTAMEESRLTVANLALGGGLAVRSFSTDFASLAGRGAKMKFDLAAFGGTIRGDLQNRGRVRGHIHFDAGGTFSQISVAEMGPFFEVAEKTNGTIQSGKFTFQGSPRDLAHATIEVRLDEAVDFQWGASRWTSLAGGATLIHNRVLIPELRLKQPHNEVNMSGETAIPSASAAWWQQEFSLNIAAKIDSLGELAPLLGPGLALLGKNLAYMSGRVALDGSVRGHSGAFAGQIIVSGSQLWYGSAPLDELRASIKLDGARWQFTNLEFVHGDDYLRAEGVLDPDFTGALALDHYNGRLRASVSDLSNYWPLIEPFVSWCEGGLVLDWSGESNPKTSAGFFHAQLKNFRTIKAPHPIHADIEATYSPGKIAFSNFAVSDADSAFTAKVNGSPGATRLEAIRLTQRGNVALEGEATLPLDLWNGWASGGWLDALDFSGTCKATLVARKLQIHDALVLTGRQFPVKGLLDGNLAVAGTPSALQLSGQMDVEHTQFPAGENLPLVEDLSAGLAFHDGEIRLLNGSARVASGTANFDGTIRAGDARNPSVNLRVKVESPHAVSPSGPRADLIPDLDLLIDGPWKSAQVTGAARSLRAHLSPALSLAGLLTPGAAVMPVAPPAAGVSPYCDWLFQIRWTDIGPEDFADAPAGKISRDLELRGRGANLRAEGIVSLRGARLATAHAQFSVTEGTVRFAPWGEPVFQVTGSGSAPGCTFDAVVFGTQSRRVVLLRSEPPMPSAELLERIVHGRDSAPVKSP